MSTLPTNPMPTGLAPEKPNALSILSICYYIIGALGTLCVIFATIILAIGIVMLTCSDSILSNPQLKEMMVTSLSEQGGKIAALDPKQIFMTGGWMYVIIGSIWLFFALIFTTLQFYAAASISKGKRYIFCIIISCVNLINFPLGTALGITALIILTKDNIKQYFELQKINT